MNNINKRLLVLGAGEAQFNLVKVAHELDYTVIVCDMRPNMQVSKEADIYYQIDYMDRNAILNVAQKEKIDGVISNSEAAMLNVAYLVEKLGLPGNPLESIQRLVSKEYFREQQRACGLYTPSHEIVSNPSELKDKSKNLKFPILVKPVESSGTRGVTKIVQNDIDKLSIAFSLSEKFSRNGLVTLEEFVDMPSLYVFQADIFVANNIILWDGLFTTKRSREMPFVPMTHIFPCIAAPNEIDLLKMEVEQFVRKSDLLLGEFNVEAYIINDGNIFIIEINARQGGNHIPELIYEYSGVNLTKLLVTTAVDDWSYYDYLKNFNRKENYVMLHMVFPLKPGIYKGLHINKELEPYITRIKELVLKQELVKKNNNAEDVLAYIWFKFDNRKNQMFYAENIENYIFAIID